jgi:ribosomal protein S18 acetylase RimI-like enzyme
VELRRAVPRDVSAVHELLGELAAVEGNQAAFTATTDELHDALFGDPAKMICWVAAEHTAVVGTALCSPCFVAASCQPVLRLLSLVVHEEGRGAGIGSALLAAVAEHAADGYIAVDFMVRESNAAAQAFYSRHGATRRSEWQTWRFQSTALRDIVDDVAGHRRGREDPR